MAEGLPADLVAVDPTEAWQPWRPAAPAAWNRKWAAHLYRRAAFGASEGEIEAALKAGFEKALDRLLVGEPDAAERWETLADIGRYYDEPTQVRAWWLYAMLEGGHPLREKLTLFWHNHFATGIAKVVSPRLMFAQNLTLRRHALGRFRPFLLDASRDAAMLVWLDSNENLKGRPNENFAREVMELFSLGVGHYAEKDVQEAARAFTGWHHDAEVKAFEFNAGLHDDGPKALLGASGHLTGEDALEVFCDQPACARFLVGKLYAYLVSETPPPRGLLAPLEARFRGSDCDIADLVRAVLGSRLFFSDHAYRRRVKWPVEYALAAVRALVPGRLPPGDLVEPLAKMGQALFAPPNVKGWRTGTDWLNSATLLARNNFAEAVAMGTWSGGGATGVARSVTTITATVLRPATDPALEDAAGEDIRGALSVAGAGAVAAPAPAPKAEPAKPAEPPVPPADRDVLAIVFASEPESVPALVRRMGEILFGEPVAGPVRAKIEKFLLDGKWGLSAKQMEAPAFRHRAREALHALMCLPEYQLS